MNGITAMIRLARVRKNLSQCETLSGLTEDDHPNDTDNDGVENVDPLDPDYALGDDDGDGILNGDEEEGMELIDNNPPVMIAPPDFEVVTDSSSKSISLVVSPTATDIVQGDVVECEEIPFSDADLPFEGDCIYYNDADSSYPVGAHTVTWTAIDAAGNVTTDTQIVTVTAKATEDGGKKSSGGGGGGGSLGAMVVFVLLALTWRRRKLALA